MVAITAATSTPVVQSAGRTQNGPPATVPAMMQPTPLTSSAGRVRDPLAFQAPRNAPRRAVPRRQVRTLVARVADDAENRPSKGASGDLRQAVSTAPSGADVEVPQLPPLQEVLSGGPAAQASSTASSSSSSGSAPSPAQGSKEDQPLTDAELKSEDPTVALPSGSVRGPRWQQLRDAAKRLAGDLDAAAAVQGRGEWLYFTLPAKPVAGEKAIVFYNRARSEALRERPRIVLQVGYNDWELDTKGVDLYPGECPRHEGEDWWCVTLEVPEEAYELKYVFSDGEQAYDNNLGEDYTTPVLGPTDPTGWAQILKEREAAAEAARRAEEAKQLAEQRAAELRAREKGDVDRAQGRVDALKRDQASLREGASSEFKAGGGEEGAPMQWRVTEPAAVVPGGSLTLRYNTAAGPLQHVQGQEPPVLVIGTNNWETSEEHKFRKAVSSRPPTGATAKRVGAPPEAADAAAAANPAEEGEWWEVTVPVPPNAAVLKFVVQRQGQWDNNGGQDYKVAVALPEGYATLEAWADSLQDAYLAQERGARLAVEAAEEKKQKEREEKAQRIAEKAVAVRKRQMRHVLFTDPEAPAPGKPLTVYYNPNNTALAGCSDVYLRGGFNRWKHATSLGPLKMEPPKEGDHFKAKVDVPDDAAVLDLVFANVPEGDGLYDNRGGLDYHIPVENPTTRLDPLHVVHIAVEMAPICKVGGLGDVVTSISRAVKDMGNLVEVVVPRYSFFNNSPLLGNTQLECEFEWGGTRIYVSTCVVEGLRCFFIEPKNGMFEGNHVYGGRGDDVKFDFFCRAALEFLLQTGRQPDILHCHDWSSATVAKAYWDEFRQYGLYKSSVVFTIHNLLYGEAKLGEAAFYCQRFTTVSPTYAFEIGGNPIIAPHAGKFMGIRNGIDMDLWDPENDQFLPMAYSAEQCEEGKKAARDALRSRLNMTGWEDRPIVSVVSRLTKQKGIHLIKHAAWRTIDRGAQFVLLGSAPDSRVQAEFDALSNSMSSDHCRFAFAFDEPLSHLIYAASDIVLVPSMFEPCGLTQLIAMRYGAVPVVRSTGGLRDTVFDVDYDKARAAWEMEGSTDWQADGVDETNGFAFEGTDEGSLDYGLNRALDTWYNDKAFFRGLQARVMRQDWSWARPAVDYVELYYRAMKDVMG